MKLASINPLLIKQLLTAAFLTSAAYADIVIKATSGNDLVQAASWSAGLGPAPTSGDVATWDSPSPGGAIIASAPVAWSLINLTGIITIHSDWISGTTASTTFTGILSGSGSLVLGAAPGVPTTTCPHRRTSYGNGAITNFTGAITFEGGGIVLPDSAMVNSDNHTVNSRGPHENVHVFEKYLLNFRHD